MIRKDAIAPSLQENVDQQQKQSIQLQQEHQQQQQQVDVPMEEQCENRDLLHFASKSSSLVPSTEEEPLFVQTRDILDPGLPPNGALKMLLVFRHGDEAVNAIQKAAEKIGFDVNVCNQFDEAAPADTYEGRPYELVIVDTRPGKAIDYETVCRNFRKGTKYCPLLAAIVKRCAFERDDGLFSDLLDSGYAKCIVESTNVSCMVNELIQLREDISRIYNQWQLQCRSLYAALDYCRDIVIITDHMYKCQYANKALERVLNIRVDDIMGQSVQDTLVNDPIQVNAMGSALQQGRTWSGTLTLRKKSIQDTLIASCQALALGRRMSQQKTSNHFILVLDPSAALDANLISNRGSLHSVRRGSTDVRSSIGSDHLRRTSLAKLSALPLEAPITKIITLIDQARERAHSNSQVVMLLDKVEDSLRCTELYSPSVKEDIKFRMDEPVASDLVSALLSKQLHAVVTSNSSRRSSNDSANYRPSKSTAGLSKAPVALRDLLETSLSWEFDIFRLEDLTKHQPLQHLGMNLFVHFDVMQTLNCDERTLFNWLTVMEANYRSDNTYHNSTHAADVMQATAGFLQKEKMKFILDPLDEVVSLIAAACHDLDHPGRSSAFLCNSSDKLALLYNDITVLESHHAALMFGLTLGDDRINIFKNLDKDAYKNARLNIIDMILATEMTKHFEHLAKFVDVFCTKPTDPEGDSGTYYPLSAPENTTLVKRMMIKCADVSNPTRPLTLCVEWARRIAEEYFQQTDEEKTLGLPVVMPMFDRNTCSIPKSQIGFVDYIINDMIEAWNAFIDMPELVTYMRRNYASWKEFETAGHTTLNDIRKLQATVLSPTYSCPSKINE